MRGLVIEQSQVYVAQRLPEVNVVDENGFETGEKETQYDVPVELTLNVKDINNEMDMAMFGLSAISMKRIDATDYDLEGYVPAIGDMFWVDIPVGESGQDGNYVVERVVKATTCYIIYLKSISKINSLRADTYVST